MPNIASTSDSAANPPSTTIAKRCGATDSRTRSAIGRTSWSGTVGSISRVAVRIAFIAAASLNVLRTTTVYAFHQNCR